MFSGIKNFLSRHRRKFVISGVVVASGYFALNYAQRKLLEYQEKKAREFFEQSRRSQHFEITERTCNQAITGLAPNLCERVLQNLNTDPILEKIRKNPERKVELWKELKVLAISRLVALVYASSMLVITLRIQFNILGGYLYKDTVNGDVCINNEIQQNYVSLIQYFLCDGIDDLCALIKLKTTDILNGYDLSRKLTLMETEQIFWSIQMAVNSDEQDPGSHLSKYVYPNDLSEYPPNGLLSKMYIETIDMLECDDTSSLNTNIISRGFSIVVDNIADFYMKPLNGAITNGKITNDNKIIEICDNDEQQPCTSKTALLTIDNNDLDSLNINSVTIPLAKLIPIIDGLAKQRFSNASKPPGLATSLITLYLISDKAKLLGANVYEAFCQ